MPEIAVCIPVFIRTDKVIRLLQSVEKTEIGKVYIADDGEMTDKKKDVYSRDFRFDLEVFDLEYDSGVGEKRNILAKRPTEDYLLFIDSDMLIPKNYEILLDQIKSKPDIGFIAGMYMESDRLYTVASDFFIKNGTLHRDIRSNKQIETVAGAPMATFDFLPQVGILRKECVADYNWDPNYTIMREHADFFVGHWKQKKWKMAQSPSVYFPHFPGGNKEFNSHRHSSKKFHKSNKYFLNKWDLDGFTINNGKWIHTYPSPETQSKVEQLLEIYHDDGAGTAIKSVVRYLNNRFI